MGINVYTHTDTHTKHDQCVSTILKKEKNDAKRTSNGDGGKQSRKSVTYIIQI